MKALRNGMLAFAALALAGAFAGTANAQAKGGGSFTLPFEAKLGDVILPAGDYTFTVRHAMMTGGPIYLVTFTQKGQGGETINAMQQLEDAGSRSLLVAVRSGGKYRIRILRLPTAKLVLNFSVPKEERTQIAAAPELVKTVPVLVAMK